MHLPPCKRLESGPSQPRPGSQTPSGVQRVRSPRGEPCTGAAAGLLVLERGGGLRHASGFKAPLARFQREGGGHTKPLPLLCTPSYEVAPGRPPSGGGSRTPHLPLEPPVALRGPPEPRNELLWDPRGLRTPAETGSLPLPAALPQGRAEPRGGPGPDSVVRGDAGDRPIARQTSSPTSLGLLWPIFCKLGKRPWRSNESPM